MSYTANQWLKNLDQRIGMRIHTPDDHELERLGGKVLEKYVCVWMMMPCMI